MGFEGEDQVISEGEPIFESEDAVLRGEETIVDNEGGFVDSEEPLIDGEGFSQDLVIDSDDALIDHLEQGGDNDVLIEENDEGEGAVAEIEAGGGFDDDVGYPQNMLSERHWSEDDLHIRDHMEQKPYKVLVDIKLPSDDDEFDHLRLQGYELIDTRYPGTLPASSDPSLPPRIMLRWTTYDEAERGVEDLVWVTPAESGDPTGNADATPPGFEVLHAVDFSNNPEVSTPNDDH